MKRNEITVLCVATALLAIVFVVLGLFGVLELSNKIDTSQLIQIIITFVLVLVTVAYVKRTADIAKATRDQADASVKMAEEMRDARYGALRPIINIATIPQTPLELARQTYAKKPPKELLCKLCNVGVGPATDVYSFVYSDSGERQRRNLDTIVIGKEIGPERLSLAQKDDHWFLVAYYKDIYGRWFESSREVRLGAVNPDPLQIREIPEEELPK